MRQRLINLFSWWLPDPTETSTSWGTISVSARSLGAEGAAQDTRQRAIEECAEHAYEHFMDNEVGKTADYADTESRAAQLRDAILALGEHSA